MVLKVVAHTDPEIEAFKEEISDRTGQLEAMGWAYWIFLADEKPMGIVVVGKEPMQLLWPIGTPISRFFVLDFDQPREVLYEFASKALTLAKDHAVNYSYVTLTATHAEFIKGLTELGYEVLANRIHMTRSLDKPMEVADMLRFEQASRDDVNRFLDAMMECMSGSPDPMQSMIIGRLQELPEAFLDIWYGQEQLFFVYKDDTLIGILDLNVSEGMLGNIGVVPKYRGQGYGTEMMRFALKTLQDGGREKAALDVHADNQQAIQVYEKLGFKGTKHLKTLIWQKDPTG